MKRTLVPFSVALTLAFPSMLALAMGPAAPPSSGPGASYCYGVSCPCLNDDPSAGCRNSTGVGGRLDGFGSGSVSANDLGFDVGSVSPNSVVLILASLQQNNIPFRDGRICLGGDLIRLWKHFNSGQDGVLHIDNIADHFAGGVPYLTFASGETWNFQAWYRDAKPSSHNCGTKANLTNGYQVAFVP